MELHKFILLQTLSKSLTSSPRSTATAQKQGQLQTTCTPCRLSHKGEVQHHATSKDAIRDTDICKEPAKRHMDDWQQSEVEGADVDPEKENIRNEDIEIVTHLIICLIKPASPLNLSSTSNKEIHVNIVHSIENVYHKQTKGQEVLEDHMREVAIDDDQTLQETEDEAANIHENHHKEKQGKEDNTTLIDDDVCQFPTSLAIPVKEKFLRKALNNNNSLRLGTGSGQSQGQHLPEALVRENGQGQHCLLASYASKVEDPGEGLEHTHARSEDCQLVSSSGNGDVTKDEIEQQAEDGSVQHAETWKSTAYNSAAALVPAVPLMYHNNTVHSYSCQMHHTTTFTVAEYIRLQLEHSSKLDGHSGRHQPVTLVSSSSPAGQLFSTKLQEDQMEHEHGYNDHRELIHPEPGQQLAMQLHPPFLKQRDLADNPEQRLHQPLGDKLGSISLRHESGDGWQLQIFHLDLSRILSPSRDKSLHQASFRLVLSINLHLLSRDSNMMSTLVTSNTAATQSVYLYTPPMDWSSVTCLEMVCTICYRGFCCNYNSMTVPSSPDAGRRASMTVPSSPDTGMWASMTVPSSPDAGMWASMTLPTPPDAGMWDSFFNNIVTRKFSAHHYSVRVTDKARFHLNLKQYLVTI